MALSPKDSNSKFNRWNVIWNMDWTNMNDWKWKEISNHDSVEGRTA